MENLPKHPSDDALSAVPGDSIRYLNTDNDVETAVVKTTLWVPSFKGGKIYSYELLDGTIVSNFKVVGVLKTN